MVSEMRGTCGSIPASGTPTASRERSSSSGLPGNSDATWPSGPMPSSSRFQRGSPPIALADLGLVGARARVRPELALHPHDLRPRRELRSAAPARPSPKLESGCVGRHAALVGEPDGGAAPVGVALGRELVGALGRGAARQHDVAAGDGHLGEALRDLRRGVLGDPDLARSRDERPRAVRARAGRWDRAAAPGGRPRRGCRSRRARRRARSRTPPSRRGRAAASAGRRASGRARSPRRTRSRSSRRPARARSGWPTRGRS